MEKYERVSRVVDFFVRVIDDSCESRLLFGGRGRGEREKERD